MVSGERTQLVQSRAKKKHFNEEKHSSKETGAKRGGRWGISYLTQWCPCVEASCERGFEGSNLLVTGWREQNQVLGKFAKRPSPPLIEKGVYLKDRCRRSTRKEGRRGPALGGMERKKRETQSKRYYSAIFYVRCSIQNTKNRVETDKEGGREGPEIT